MNHIINIKAGSIIIDKDNNVLIIKQSSNDISKELLKK